LDYTDSTEDEARIWVTNQPAAGRFHELFFRARRRNISVELLKGVINYACDHNIKVIEAYPAQEKLPDAFAWIGLYKSFEKAGFRIVTGSQKTVLWFVITYNSLAPKRKAF
jgi:hypothetical protein